MVPSLCPPGYHSQRDPEVLPGQLLPAQSGRELQPLSPEIQGHLLLTTLPSPPRAPTPTRQGPSSLCGRPRPQLEAGSSGAEKQVSCGLPAGLASCPHLSPEPPNTGAKTRLLRPFRVPRTHPGHLRPTDRADSRQGWAPRAAAASRTEPARTGQRSTWEKSKALTPRRSTEAGAHRGTEAAAWGLQSLGLPTTVLVTPGKTPGPQPGPLCTGAR